MSGSADDFKRELRQLGISKSAIEAVWPSWWSDEAGASRSAQLELRFGVARRLGLSPKSIIGEEQPVFIWRHDAKFKGLSTYDEFQQSALVSFGVVLARYLLRAFKQPAEANLSEFSAEQLRSFILRQSGHVALQDLIATCWALGVPVVHLRVFPLHAKKMAAMAVRESGRHVIFIGRDNSYPASSAYHLAHEMGHIACKHLTSARALVDVDEPIETEDRDNEEREADLFAMELLTGEPKPILHMNAPARNGVELAAAVQMAAQSLRIEPGTIALCYGHQTGAWNVAYAALARLYGAKQQTWKVLNGFALEQLDLAKLDDETRAYVEAVLGVPDLG